MFGTDRSFLNPVNSNMQVDFTSWLQQKHPEMVSDFATQLGLMEDKSPMHSANLQMGQSGMGAAQGALSLPQLQNMVRGKQVTVNRGGGFAPAQNPFRNPWGLMEG